MIHKKQDISDENLIQQISLNGVEKERACQYIYEKFFGYTIKIKQKYKLEEADLRDLYADSVVTLINHIERKVFRGESKLSTYFFRIFSNKSIDRLRKNSTNKINWTDKFPNLDDSSKDFLQKMIRDETLEGLSKIMDQIGEKCRKLIWDADFWGFKPSEIAERHGFSTAKSAATAKYKCMDKLRKMIIQKTNTSSI